MMDSLPFPAREPHAQAGEPQCDQLMTPLAGAARCLHRAVATACIPSVASFREPENVCRFHLNIFQRMHGKWFKVTPAQVVSLDNAERAP